MRKFPMDRQPQKKIKSENDQTVHDPPPAAGQLHEDLLENVFSFLPIKEAVQVGTVSTRFKNVWHFNRRLLFGPEFQGFDQQELVDLVGRVFDLNKAPEIQAFCLHIDPKGVEPLIEKWLGVSILKRIKELEFKFSQPFHLNFHFLDIQILRSLKLINCEIRLPQVLTGLKFLNILVLRRLQLTENELKILISQCKFLNTLDLSECSRIRVMNICGSEHNSFRTLKIACCPNLDGIKIDVPSLRSIFYCGAVLKIQFARVLPVKEAFIKFFPTRGYLLTHMIDRLAVDLFYVTVLTTTSIFLEALAARFRNGQYREMHFCLARLRELQIFMEGGIFCNPYDVAVFLKSCPGLEVLFIDLNGYHYECGLYWKLHQKPMMDSFPYCFNRLRFVKLIGFKFENYELELVKVLLQKSINLEALVFVLPRNLRTRLLYPSDAIYYKYLFRSWAASPRARFFVFEHSNDRTISPSHSKYWYY